MALPHYLLVNEAAQVARQPVKSIRAWIYRGQLAAFRPGRRTLIREDDLQAFLEGRPQPSRSNEEHAAEVPR